MNAEKVTKVTSTISAVLVLLLAIGGFVLSYNALYDVAIAYGVPAGYAWIWPLLVDGAIVVFSLAVVRASLLKEPTRWAWSMVGLFTFATIGFNILHSGGDIVSVIVAIVAPVALVLSFETLMNMTKNQVWRAGFIRSLSELEIATREKRQEMQQMIAGKQIIVDDLTGQADKLNEAIEIARGKLTSYDQDIEAKKDELRRLEGGQIRVYLPDNLSIEQRQQIVRQMDLDGLTIGQMAEGLGVSEGTIKNDKRAMKGAMNGQYSE